ncbi:hypothetical protein LCGC14_1126370 [marine sediment metagenome]|uniref:Uncharacterized protein n=1 Tax=marine sediment metagenome TaxID=412755 RepID=A0A0F9M758_9ZZZZ
MNERNLTKNQIDGIREDVEGGAFEDWTPGEVESALLELVHDLRLADDEIERLQHGIKLALHYINLIEKMNVEDPLRGGGSPVQAVVDQVRPPLTAALEEPS